MLTDKKVQEVRSLLAQGMSQRRTATVVGVSHMSVNRISGELHDHALTHSPIQKRRERIGSFYEHEPVSFALSLRGKARERYEKVRRKVEEEIVAGRRTAMQYAVPTGS